MKEISTWGGEMYEPEIPDEYGLRIDKIDIHEISPEDFAHLACTMVNHLMRNGHVFEFSQDEMGCEHLDMLE